MGVSFSRSLVLDTCTCNYTNAKVAFLHPLKVQYRKINGWTIRHFLIEYITTSKACCFLSFFFNLGFGGGTGRYKNPIDKIFASN